MFGSLFIVAEIASAHCGSPEVAKKLVRAASDAGADAVNLQKFCRDSLLVPSDPRYKNFERIEIEEDEWKDIIKCAKDAGIKVIGEVFDERSADFMVGEGIDFIKIHPTDMLNPFMLKHVAKEDVPIILSAGGCTFDEVESALNIVKDNGGEVVCIVYGFQNFPTKLEDTNMLVLKSLKERFGLPVGFHDHIDAEDELALYLPLVAVGLGATLIEKHITDDRSKKGFDYHSSLEPHEFKRMVEILRRVEKSMGDGKLCLSDAEKNYRERMMKKIVASRTIPKGKVIEMEDITFKRAKGGIYPNEFQKIVGRKSRVEIKEDEVITPEKVEE